MSDRGFDEAWLARHMAKVTGGRSSVVERHVEAVRVGGSNPSVPTTPKKRKKFNAQRTQASDGIWCDSLTEARRWEELLLLSKGGAIRDLMPHPAFTVYTNGKRVGSFKFDAAYVEDGVLILEDTKSDATAKERSFRSRIQVFKACYPHITVREHIAG